MSELASTMRAAVYMEPGVIEVRDLPRPEPEAGEALVKVRAVGICGSDMHVFAEGRLGSQVITKPLIMGHELSGDVVALGPGTKGIEIGQRVVVEPGFACGHCRFCRSGRYNLCRDVKFMGQPAKAGAMAQYVTAPAQWLHPMPEHVSYAEGAIVEPLVVAMQAMERGDVGIESRVAIFGAGPIGLLAVQVARARGARQIISVDVLDSRLEMARNMGATATINGRDQDPVAEIRALTDGEGVDVAVELSGAPQAIAQMFRAAEKGARIVPVGLAGQPEVALPYTDIVRSGVQIHTVFRYVNQFPAALNLLGRGLIDWKPLMTHTFRLEDAVAAFALIQERKSEVIKAVLTMD